jgi:hypothetical protein
MPIEDYHIDFDRVKIDRTEELMRLMNKQKRVKMEKEKHISVWLKPSEEKALVEKAKQTTGYVSTYVFQLIENPKLDEIKPSDLRFIEREGCSLKVFKVTDAYAETVKEFKDTVDLMKGLPKFKGYRISIQVVLRSLILKELGL